MSARVWSNKYLVQCKKSNKVFIHTSMIWKIDLKHSFMTSEWRTSSLEQTSRAQCFQDYMGCFSETAALFMCKDTAVSQWAYFGRILSFTSTLDCIKPYGHLLSRVSLSTWETTPEYQYKQYILWFFSV